MSMASSFAGLQDSREASPLHQQWNAMAAAGRLDDVRAKAGSLAKTMSANIAAIRTDPDRSDSWKSDEVERLKRSANADFETWMERETRSILADVRRDYQRTLGLDGLPGDAASLAISRRDAADRVDAVKSSVELRSLLERATNSGDEVLARAIAEKALQSSDPSTFNKFIADRPQLEPAAERLWSNAQRGGHRDWFELAMLRMSFNPQ